MFKHGSIHCHMSDKAAMVRCASIHNSPILAVMSATSLVLDKTLPQHNRIWRPLLDKSGKGERWPEDLLRKACRCQKSMLGGLERRLDHRLAKVAPWSLVKIVDPSLPTEERLKAAEEFLSPALRDCCLDPFCCKSFTGHVWFSRRLVA